MTATAPDLTQLRTENVCSARTRFVVGLEPLAAFDPNDDDMRLASQAIGATGGNVPDALELIIRLAVEYACDHGDDGAAMLLRAATVVQQLNLAASREAGLL